MTIDCIRMSDGSEVWMKNRKLHREDGPAIVRSHDGYVAFYLNGFEHSFKSWFFECGQNHMTPQQVTFMLIKFGIKK